MLSDKIEGYKATGKFPTVTPAKYKDKHPYLREVDSLALANKQLDLQEAFHNRFSKSRKKNNKFPKFKSAKHSRKAYTTNNQKGTVAIIDDKYVKLPKIGKVKAAIHPRNQMANITFLYFLSLIMSQILISQINLMLSD